ncbi:pilus assembly protein TadG-related protein [Fundidesulfovibrio terrae]|uniref:pilus assembly protein TadG-related protein n=1 Tax=Fundidesulfovibrio terrae TaxID=2922866 RepID=UPI001FAEAB42|nr:pilus assembly protein TadG-related protein [Fundidesulfovibrio terrae]
MKKQPSSAKQNGTVSVLVALALIVLAGFGAFAVDLGYLKWKRGQMQAAADAAALAGAMAKVSFGTDTAKIVSEAVTYGRANVVATDNPVLAVRDEDVTINTTGLGYVEVTAGLTTGRGNPVSLFLGPILGRNLADVSATARASIWCATSSHCIKPWAIPTKFTWTDYPDKKGKYNGLLDVDSPSEMATVAITEPGYTSADVGTLLTIKTGSPSSNTTLVPGQYNPILFPGDHGGDDYRADIEGCKNNNIDVGSNDVVSLTAKPGEMVGPTKQGVTYLIDQDPTAYWDAANNVIAGSKFSDPLASPRVAIIAFYDPRSPPTSGLSSVKVYQLGAMFIKEIDGSGNVTGYFMNALAESPTRDPGGTCGTLFGVSLVRDSSR